MEDSFRSIVDRSKSILIVLPTKLDLDQAASGLSLYLALKEIKETNIYCPSPITVEFNRLVGVNKISQEIGNKNLVIKFVDYKATDIETVSWDIENGEFSLTVVPKENALPPTKEQVKILYAGITADCVILIGGTDESDFPSLFSGQLNPSNILHIGTKDIQFSRRKSYASFSRPAPSISEVVAGIIKQSNLRLDEDISTNLLMGIEFATETFTSPQTSAETFALVSELLRLGGKRLLASPSLQTYPLVSGLPQMPPTLHFTPPLEIKKRDAFLKKEEEKPQEEETQEGLGVDSSKKDESQKPPEEWLQPKIYKGTSIS